MSGSAPRGGSVAGRCRPRKDRYDVVVVGARVAGSATAMLLARAGLDVVVVDRGRLGADTASTHTVLRSGILQLSRWGLLDRVEAAGTPPIRRVTLGFGEDLVPIELSANHGVSALFAPRRTVLDPILVEAAVEAGAEYVERCRVSDIVRDSAGAVRGVVVSDGRTDHVVSAGMVVGADGTWSRVARLVEAPERHRRSSVNTVRYAYYRDIETDGVYFQFSEGVTAGLIPTNDGEVCVYGGWHCDGDTDYHRDPETVFVSRVASAHPRVAASLANARRVSGFRGCTQLPGFLRTAAGPGWALVGDAAYTKDPVSAHGISDAFRDAELCTAFVETALRRPESATEAAAAYQEDRDRLSLPMLDATTRLASYQWDRLQASALMRRISSIVQEECEFLLTRDLQMAG